MKNKEEIDKLIALALQLIESCFIVILQQQKEVNRLLKEAVQDLHRKKGICFYWNCKNKADPRYDGLCEECFGKELDDLTRQSLNKKEDL